MDNSFIVITETFGLKTVVMGAIVCLAMSLVKKSKPSLSPKVEILIRLLISLAVNLIYLAITKGNFNYCPEQVLGICGVSMLLCQIINKDPKTEQLKSVILAFLPQLSPEEVDRILKCKTYEERISLLKTGDETFTEKELNFILSLFAKTSKKDKTNA